MRKPATPCSRPTANGWPIRSTTVTVPGSLTPTAVRPRTVTTAASGGPRWLPDNRLLVGSSIYDISTTGQVQPSGSAPSGLVGWSSGGTRYAFVTRKLTYAADGSFRGVEDLEVATLLTGPRTVWRSTPVSFHQSTGFHGNVVNGVLVLPGGEGILFWVDPDMSDAADGMHVFELRAPGAAPVDLGVTVGQDVSLAPHGVIAIGSPQPLRLGDKKRRDLRHNHRRLQSGGGAG